MKKILKIAVVLSFLSALVACSKETIGTPEKMLEPNYMNIHGIWQATESEGVVYPEEIFPYWEFNRKDHSFTEYTCHHTMYPDADSGYFVIRQELEAFIISGDYDEKDKDWSTEYEIIRLTENEMVWKRMDNGKLLKMERREALPEEYEALKK